MDRVAIVFAIALGLPSLAQADIYKCTDYYGIVYQSRPCGPGQSQTLMIESKPAPPAPAAAPPPPSPASRAPVPTPYGRDVAFRRTTIALGMSDDEVLNLPGWGVPNHIDRSRDGRIYHEWWSYRQANGELRWLTFANARLTSIDVEPAIDRYATLEPPPRY